MKKEKESKEGDVTTTVLPCGCNHAGQDKMYGRGRRVHNLARAKGQWRCTVCGAIKGG